MADNHAITPGSGAYAACDEATYSGDTAKIQLVRQVIVTGTEGAKTVSELAWSSTGELGVIQRRDLQRIEVSVTGVTTATTSYSAGDQVGAQLSFANAARATGGTGMVVGATVVDDSACLGACDIVLFSGSVTVATDNAVASFSDADMDKFVGIVPVNGPWYFQNNNANTQHSLAIPYYTGSGTTLYAALVTRTAHSFFTSATDLKVCLWLERN